MKTVARNEIDVGLALAYQRIFDLRVQWLRAQYAGTPHELSRLRTRWERAVEELNWLEREAVQQWRAIPLN